MGRGRLTVGRRETSAVSAPRAGARPRGSGRREGSAYFLVLVTLLIAALGLSVVMSGNTNRAYRIQALRRRLVTTAAAEAGLVCMYHRLKEGTFANVDRLETSLAETLDTVPFEASIVPDPASQTVRITSTAVLEGYTRRLEAVATFASVQVGRIQYYRWSIRYLP